MNYKKQLLAKSKKLWIFILLATVISINSCKKNDYHPRDHGGKGNNAGREMLMLWNDAAFQAVTRITGLPPMPEARIYAIVNIAMYDALNSIEPRCRVYALLQRQANNASLDAAIATAAHDAIVALLPPQATYADSLLKESLSKIGEGIAKQKGIDAGKASASAILTKRTGDGSETAQSLPFTQGTLPGEYRSTPPFDGPPFNGFVAVPGWGKVKTFGLSSSDQFRPGAPYPLNSNAYTADFNEIKSLGNKTSADRTTEQTEIALFWLNSAPSSFNRIARNLIFSKNINTWKAARLLTLVAIAEADANIGSFEAKFFYNYWRPITAVRLADNDGNPNTVGDASWDVLAPPTPPIPDYPSNHAVDGGAGAEVLKNFFGTDNISFEATSTSLPGVTRLYNSFSQASRDNALSRIYVGYHFRNAVIKGEEQGKKIGKYIFDHYLQEE